MKPRSYNSEGIVLARRHFGEADRILVLYTKNFGRVSLMAKGVRRPKSRKRGHIEMFNYIKFQAVAGKGLDTMMEAEVIEDFKEIRKNLKKVSLAYYFAEVLGRITHELESNTQLFDLMLGHLAALKSERHLKELRLDFIKKLLVIMGYWPEGKTLPSADTELEKVIERQIASFRVGKRMVE